MHRVACGITCNGIFSYEYTLKQFLGEFLVDDVLTNLYFEIASSLSLLISNLTKKQLDFCTSFPCLNVADDKITTVASYFIFLKSQLYICMLIWIVQNVNYDSYYAAVQLVNAALHLFPAIIAVCVVIFLSLSLSLLSFASLESVLWDGNYSLCLL